MRFCPALFVRRAVADLCPDRDEGRAIAGASLFKGRSHRLNTVTLFNPQHLPAVGFKAFPHIFSESDRGSAVDGNPVVVVKADQLVQTEMTGQRGCFGSNPFHQTAVASVDICIMVDDGKIGAIEFGSKPSFSKSHPYSSSKSLPQRPGSHFNSGGQSIFRMPRCPAAPLPELLDLLEGEIVAGKMQQRIKQHRTVPGGKNKTIAIGPVRSARIVFQITRPEGIGHRRPPHGQTRMAGFCLLDSIYGEKSDGVHRKLIDRLLQVCHPFF